MPIALFGLVSCSLMGLTEFDLGECETDEQCWEAFNPARGFYAECAAFQCRKVEGRKQCVQIESEICDGLDNDCDHLVDEGQEEKALITVRSEALVTGVPAASRVSLLQLSGTSEQLYFTDEKGASGVVELPSGEPLTALENWTQAEPDDGEAYSREELSELKRGCYASTGEFSSCEVSDVAVARADEVGFFAQVDAGDCSSGEVRVGVVESNRPDRLIDRGRGARDPSYRGVLTDGSPCTANLSDACSTAKAGFAAGEVEKKELAQVCGASAIAIAGLSDQALVAYLGLATGARRCPVGTTVFGLGLALGEGELSSPFHWSNPTGDGVPEALGQTSGGASPVVHGIADEGFIVGFGGDEGQVELLWVPRQPKPPKNDGLTCGAEDPLCDDRSAFSTSSLLGVVRLASLGSLGQFDGVRIASLELTEGLYALAVTWVQGCLREQGATFQGFAQVLVLQVADGEAVATAAGDPIDLGEVPRAPTPVASDVPFVTPGFFRPVAGMLDELGNPVPEGPPLESEQGGRGFYVLLGDQRALRVLVYDGKPLDEKEVLFVPAEARRALETSSADSFISHDPTDDRLVRASFVCE